MEPVKTPPPPAPLPLRGGGASCPDRSQGHQPEPNASVLVQERSPLPRAAGEGAVLALLVVLISLAWLTFSAALLARHHAYRTNAFDLGFFDQIIWNTSQGRWFETTFVDYNFLGQHVEPVLLLFAGVYRVAPRVEVLLLAQAAVAAWAAWPLYLAARRVLASATAALLVAAAYLLAPHLHGAVLFDFHPEVMGTAGIFGAFALLVSKHPGWALVALGSVFLLKEDAGLAAAGFALIVWLRGYRRHALALAAASALYAVLVIGVFMPPVRGGAGDLQERYGYLGKDAPGVVTGALRRPDIVIAHLAGGAQRRALAYLVGSQALLPLAGPAALAAAPLLAANLLATHPPQRDLTLHYVVLPFALVLVATVLGVRAVVHSQRLDPLWRWVCVRPGRRVVLLATALLVAEGVSWLLGSPLGPRRFDPAQYRATEHTRAIDRVLHQVPPAVPLSAQSGLLPHLSQRPAVWEFPRLEAATYVVVDRNGWRSSQAEDAGYQRVLASLPALGYCLLVEDDGVLLWTRRPTCASRS
jgi:uncharacterized membrane protein